MACFRTCLTQNGSQRGRRAPAGQWLGGGWPRPATQHRPPPLAGAPSGLWWPRCGESANGILVGDLRWPRPCEAISFPPSLSPAYSSAAVGVSFRLRPLHAALIGSWITAGAWSLTGCRLLAFIFSTRTSRLGLRGYSSADPPAENPNCHPATGAAFYARLAGQSVLPWLSPPLVPFPRLSGFVLLSGPWR
jgi:hypothetical protein